MRRIVIALRPFPLLLALIGSPLPGPLPLAGQAAAVPVTVEEEASSIRPGDVVRLVVWPDTGLSGEFPVNQYGTVVLPMLGEIDVSSQTHRSLRERVMKDLDQRLVSPSVELVVLRRVRVLGEVNEAGVFFLDPTMTVADALALAKGLSALAQEGRVVLRRGGAVIDGDLRVETPISDLRIRSGDELWVPQRSWLDRHTGAVIGGVSALLGLMVALVAR